MEVLRHARMPGGLQFVLILPDGSKSLVSADWTDYKATSCTPQPLALVGSLENLLRLRGLVDIVNVSVSEWKPPHSQPRAH